MPILYNDQPIEIAEARGDLRFSSVPFDSFPNAAGMTTLIGGRVVSFANLFATQAYVAAAVMRLLTWSVRVPLKCYRRTSEDSRERLLPGQHPLADAIVDPWDRGAQADLVMSLLGPLLVHGNGLMYVTEGARGKIAFDGIDWRTASPIAPFQNRISGWTVTRDAQEETYSVDQVIHIRWWSALGPVGISPLSQLGTTIVVEEAAQRYQVGYLRNSARPASAVSGPDGVVVGKELRAEIRADLDRIYAGPDYAGRPMLLPGGLKWEAVGHTAHEAELNETRKVTREEICAVYQIPPPMLGILDNATYSNIDTQREMSYTDSLGPPMVLIEQLINAQLVRGLLREDDIYVEFDFGPVLRGDRLKEIEALREAISVGLMTPHEGRGVLNLSRIDNPLADELWMPVNNLAPMGSVPAAPTPPGGD
jgi:HK97 family phage portal protein